VSRRLFATGCWILVVMAAVHLLGHYGLVTGQGGDETHRQLLSLMREYRRDLGLGMVRSTMDILAGFSLAFSLQSAAAGLMGLLVLRHESRAPGLLRQLAIVYAGAFGVFTAVAIRYWFPAPLAFITAAFACFVAAVAVSVRRAG
jgi:hypothetical protein